MPHNLASPLLAATVPNITFGLASPPAAAIMQGAIRSIFSDGCCHLAREAVEHSFSTGCHPAKWAIQLSFTGCCQLAAGIINLQSACCLRCQRLRAEESE